MKLNKNIVVFTGGGTGGHIYPGLAVAQELRIAAEKNNKELTIYWIGCSKGMDGKIISKAVDENGEKIVDSFIGIPSGKLRRYFSFQNFIDLFRIIGGYFAARWALKKIKPAVLFSKGGFVSVPPCFAARYFKIPVFTHECDFTLGLANRLNFMSAQTMFVSYEETKKRLSEDDRKRVIVTGNPVRSVFYSADEKKGLEFLKIGEKSKPVLLVLGGSSGARQINELIVNNLEWLTQKFIVVHQTGLLNTDEKLSDELHKKFGGFYKPYQFIYEQMPDVVAAADVILSRAGANSIWESAVLNKPMLLIPLCGSGTRGDQVDNARFFEKNEAARVLVGNEVTSENLVNALSEMLKLEVRNELSENVKKLTGNKRPAEEIAKIIYNELS